MTHSFMTLMLAALAACSSSSKDTQPAQFKSADDAHLERALLTASGTDYEAALLFSALLSIPPSTCPAIAQQGAQTTLTGGCTTNAGSAVGGTATLENLGANSDSTQPATADFANFTLSTSGNIAFDGTISLAPAAPPTVVTTDLDMTFGGIAGHSALIVQIPAAADGSSTGGSLTAVAGSTVEIDGLGSAEVSGTWTIGENGGPSSGSLTLTGADTLVFNIAQGDSNDCYTYTIDDTGGGSLCPTALTK